MVKFVLLMNSIAKLCIGAVAIAIIYRFASSRGYIKLDYSGESMLWIIASILAVFILILALFMFNGFQITIGDKADALRGAAWELVKLMENSGPGGAESRASKAEATTERFAVTGGAVVATASARPALIGAVNNPRLTEAGLTLMEQYWKDSAKFRKSRGGVRSAAMIFTAIIDQGNLHSARIFMIEYMKEQRADEAKSMPNLATMKFFLDIPDEWPSGDLPERVRDRGATLYQHITSGLALGRVRHSAFSGLSYRTPSVNGRPALVVEGEAIKKAMREFIRTDDTAQAFEEGSR